MNRNQPRPIVTAASIGDLLALKQLIAAGEDLDSNDGDGRTALIHAAINGDVEAVKVLIQVGAAVALADANGFSALHFAAQNYRVEVAEQLLASGTPVDAIDRYGNTPLWRAVFNARGRTSLVTILVAAGARPTRKNDSGVSPIDLAQTIGQADIIAALKAWLQSVVPVASSPFKPK